MHSNFYVSPSSFNFQQYEGLIQALRSCGWKATFVWQQKYFLNEAKVGQEMQLALFKAISCSDVFIAMLPGYPSSSVEFGAAYALCEKIFLVSRKKVYVKQTGLCDAHIAGLPGVAKLWCEPHEITALLKSEFSNLIQ